MILSFSWLKLGGFAAIFFSVYTLLPTLIVRLCKFGVPPRGQSRAGIALTFDDGPDPAHTPQLLDLLRRHQIKATFFVLGSKASQHPELIRRMHREGHLIGIHNYEHWTNALLTPRRVRRQLEKTAQIIERLTGAAPVHYRPPWGVINVFDLLLLKRFRLVLWSLMVGDWRCRGGKDQLRAKLLTKLKNGDVLVLHDSGQTLGAERDAPAYMLEALRDVLDESRQRGYTFLRIDETCG
ncbi:polysaccharide deacetylase family protein [Paenibacillus athensensis]|uniref:Polysaccharide deacetylase family protein n=1 Tax=Paenibacillus athensensis TaxID=1967502 RepID=A0A4Y8QB25_9BACL|nr:polysaccharide deacetylase family protein [Paenibacillus athensensis]MCD1257626.1 polysaccharide deacetylase family protein [Paenibacillus athensensis]